jgi:hypothetical protein
MKILDRIAAALAGLVLLFILIAASREPERNAKSANPRPIFCREFPPRISYQVLVRGCFRRPFAFHSAGAWSRWA